ncbi:MAG: hypothetical protein ACRC16_22015 [Aeromonas salmonicida]
MTDTKWTPGPYKAYCGESTHGWWVILDSKGDEIGSTDGGFDHAEAHLFAAAPELYEALDLMLQRYGYETCEYVQKSQTALAKARGERDD